MSSKRSKPVKVNAWFYRGEERFKGRPGVELIELDEFEPDGSPRVHVELPADLPDSEFFAAVSKIETVFDYIQSNVGRDFADVVGIDHMPKIGCFYRFEGEFVLIASEWHTVDGHEYEEDYDWNGTWREATPEEALELRPCVEEVE